MIRQVDGSFAPSSSHKRNAIVYFKSWQSLGLGQCAVSHPHISLSGKTVSTVKPSTLDASSYFERLRAQKAGYLCIGQLNL
jgi:hypothetical protein